MTSQKGAPTCWGSNEALPRAQIPSMQPEGQPLHAIPRGWPGPAHWLRGWAPMRSASTTRASSVTSLDPQHGVVVMETWRQCILRSIPCVAFSKNSNKEQQEAVWKVLFKTFSNLKLALCSVHYKKDSSTVEPRYNEVLGTVKITLLYQVSHYIRVKKTETKSWDQQNYLVIRGFCYIWPLYNEVPLYYQILCNMYRMFVHRCTLLYISWYLSQIHQMGLCFRRMDWKFPSLVREDWSRLSSFMCDSQWTSGCWCG